LPKFVLGLNALPNIHDSSPCRQWEVGLDVHRKPFSGKIMSEEFQSAFEILNTINDL
jgi:hypothetical protein